MSKLKELKIANANKKWEKEYGDTQKFMMARGAKKHKETLEKNADASREVQEKLKKCLSSPLFQEYLDEYRKREESLIQDILTLPMTTPEQYGVVMFDLIGQLRNVRFLIGKSKRDEG